MTGGSAPTTNIIVPLEIESLTAGSPDAKIAFRADLQKQYYLNADMEFKVPEPSCLRMVHLPIYAALKRISGQWKEVYDQDQHFQQIGEVTESPTWNVSPTNQRRLLTTTIQGIILPRFYDFVRSVRDHYMDSHDVVLEISGKSFVQPGYPKAEDGVQQYGAVDFEITQFDAIYMVPKGGPTGSRFLS